MTETKKKIMRRVIRADRSPLNERRWVLTLECGHEEWINSKSRPQRQTQSCLTCLSEAPR